jgi:omega-6 fatty acid desaturase (delta-12 desaturase)
MQDALLLEDIALENRAPPRLSRGQLLRELDQFARPSNAKGLWLFAREYVVYWTAIALVLFAPWLAVKILASFFAGFRLTSFYTLAHDAAHRTLVANRKLNWWLAMFMGIPSGQNYRMWTLDHNGGHHPKTNGEAVDFYRPYSKAEFDRLPRITQVAERIARSPTVIGFGFNFLFRWLLPLRLRPTEAIPPKHRPSAWRYFAAMMTYHATYIAFLCTAPTFAPISLTTAFVLGWLVPVCVFSTITGGSLYLMHTNRRIPWFKEGIPRTGDFAPELCAVHLTLPDAFSRLVNNVYAHVAHHAHAGIPSYLLLDAQKHLDKALGSRAVVEPMSFSGALASLRACKLYDYDRHQWLDFDGKPTAPPIRLDSRGD